jgi:hypothetical protein
MKKIILSITLIFLALSGYCQYGKPVKLDSLVTVLLPAGYQVKDTLGNRIFSGNGLYGYMTVIRQPNAKNNAALNKASDLNNALKAYIKGIQGQSDGSSVQNVRDTLIGKRLKAKAFTLETDNGSGDINYRYFVLLYTTEVTYTFQYVFPNNRVEVVKDENKAFMSSITISPELQRDDQYLSNATGLSPINKIEIFGGGALLAMIIVLLVVRKKKQPSLG